MPTLAWASGAFRLGTVGTSLAGGACLLLLMSTTVLPLLRFLGDVFVTAGNARFTRYLYMYIFMGG